MRGRKGIKNCFKILFCFGLILIFSGHSGNTFAQFDPVGDGGLCANGNANIPNPAPGYGITSNMGYRNLCERGAGSCWHKGTDYGTPCGARIPGPPPGCKKIGGSGTPRAGGYGFVARFDCGPNNAGQKIMIQYAHLQGSNSYNASSNTITTGSSGVGGCHLDYILTVGGKVVDAQCATGSVTGNYTYGRSSRKSGPQCPRSGQVNICDGAFGEQLRKHSDEKFSGSGGKNNYDIANGRTTPGGGGGSSNQNEEGFDPSGQSTTVNQGTVSGPQSGSPSDPNRPPIEEEQRPDIPEPTGPPEPPFDPSALRPRCQSTTCISQDHIDNAKHKNVQDDKVNSYVKMLSAKEGCEDEDLRKSNVTVYRQIEGEYENYPDAFCLRQGCGHVDEKCR